MKRGSGKRNFDKAVRLLWLLYFGWIRYNKSFLCWEKQAC